MIDKYQNIGVLGGGAWGTALAQVAALAGANVKLWAIEEEVVKDINENNRNSLFLPNAALSKNIKAVNKIEDIASVDAILSVIPAQYTRSSLAKLNGILKPKTPIALCSKGIEQSSLKFMTDVLLETLPDAIALVLSGPSFAKDVVKGLPTAVTLACEDEIIGQKFANSIALPTFRPYISDDLIGAEIGGAVKNVLAIACGLAEGKGLGESARSALITRGFAEMSRLAVKLGAKHVSLMGLCGLGDLVLTCSSVSSRNFSLGIALGEGLSAEEALSGKLSVAEGAATAPALISLANSHNVSMPICENITKILAGEITADQAINNLLNRPLKIEIEI